MSFNSFRQFIARHRSLERWKLFAVLVIALATLRLSLAEVVRRSVNRVLSGHENFHGEIGDVSIGLWRGAYSVEDVRFVKRSGQTLEPFFSVKEVDFSIEWSALLHGSLVAEVIFDRPDVNLTVAADPESPQPKTKFDWRKTMSGLFPFEIDQVLVHDGKLRFHDPTKQPVVDVEVSGLNVRVQNLTNARTPPPAEHDEEEHLVATIELAARTLETADFWLEMRLDPLASEPTFDMNAALQNVDLVRLNDFLRAYGNFDVSRGTFHVYTEMASAHGRVTGYVKPFFEDLDVMSFREIDDPGDALNALWEAIVGSSATILENRSTGRMAARIPIEGKTSDAGPDVFTAVGSLLRNAFISALLPRVEDSVTLAKAEQEQTGEEKEEQKKDEAERARREEQAEAGGSGGGGSR